ncbi:MAG: hypothetical protein JW760_12475 [Spirochaetales bacterium]|nr:hypothetical protein [Spirochaetales bacterium]
MKKKLLAVIIFVSAVSGMACPESPGTLSAATDPYRLSLITLMKADTALIEDLLSRGKDGPPFQLGILNINLILLTDKLSSLDEGVAHLEKVRGADKETPLYRVYLGMAEAFTARRRTVFGLKNLQNTETLMTGIPADYPDWHIRLLRGMSYYRLGTGLPGIGPMKETKEKALSLGEGDLLYVLEQHRENPVGVFLLETYDWETLPVPDAAAAFAREVLFP